MNRLNTPFYLTGGTALGRAYFQHRYSDDLDLFVNQDEKYSQYVQQVFDQFETAASSGEFLIDYGRIQKYENYALFFLIKETEGEKIGLKIELANDIALSKETSLIPRCHSPCRTEHNHLKI